MAREDHMVAAITAKVRNRRRLYQGEASIATMKGVDYLSFIIASDLLLDAGSVGLGFVVIMWLAHFRHKSCVRIYIR